MITNIKQVAQHQKPIKYLLSRIACLFGIHLDYYGALHTKIRKNNWPEPDGSIENDNYEASYKCYHCLFCDKPIDKESCNE